MIPVLEKHESARGPARNGADGISYMIVASSGPGCPSIISSATPGEGVTVTPRS